MAAQTQWTLIISGGGSGGHLYPALAVARELAARDAAPSKLICLSTERAIERQILQAQGIEQHSLPAIDSHALRRHPIRSLWQLLKSVQTAQAILRSVPHPVVLGTGGFGSIPGALAAWLCRVPLLLLEQNVVPGRATTLLSRLASGICTSFEETKQALSACDTVIHLTGNPVRAEIARPTLMHSDGLRRTLLILGGSQGARSLNRAMLEFVQTHPGQLAGWKIVHQAGKQEQPAVAAAYHACGIPAQVQAFVEDLPELLRETGLAITRAGGTSLAEFACAGIPALIVPFPRSLREHQRRNAQVFAQAGAAVMAEETAAEFQAEFSQQLLRLLVDDRQRETMCHAMRNLSHPDAAQKVADLILQMHA